MGNCVVALVAQIEASRELRGEGARFVAEKKVIVRSYEVVEGFEILGGESAVNQDPVRV
jgi:hypothetical protein